MFRSFGNAQFNSLPSGPDFLWAYPLRQLLNRDAPFDDTTPPELIVRPDLIDACETASFAYAFWYYYVLLYGQYGVDVATAVRAEHIFRLNVLSPSTGDFLGLALQLIENGLESNNRHPFTLPASGKEMPPEFYVASHLLIGLENSPYFGQVHALTENSGLPTAETHDATFDIAECLVWSRDRAYSHFANVLDGAVIDARDLKAWIDARNTAD